MNTIAEMTITTLRQSSVEFPANYAAALAIACDASPPPFGTAGYGELYRRVASDPAWLASSLLINAAREADGATRLWSLAACTDDHGIRIQVRQHAVDEARHARWYVSLLDNVFPGAIDDETRAEADRLFPRYSDQSELTAEPGSPFAHPVGLDDLVQMNIAEIRTTVNHLLQRPIVIAHCPPPRRAQLAPILDKLLRDEIRHVEYSALLIEAHVRKVGFDAVVDLMKLRLDEFNQITNTETGQDNFESV